MIGCQSQRVKVKIYLYIFDFDPYDPQTYEKAAIFDRK